MTYNAFGGTLNLAQLQLLMKLLDFANCELPLPAVFVHPLVDLPI